MAIHEPYRDTNNEERRVEVTPVEARQGLLGRPVLVVLVVALILAMLAWAASEFWGMSIDTQTPRDETQATVPATEPATENENIVNDNPPAGEKLEKTPAIVDPTTPGNQ
jgi:hypothetical protein